MLNIAICDDNVHFCAYVKEFCVSFFNTLKDYQLHVFDNGMQLINCTQNFDILLLDIEMSALGGFEVAEEINKRHSETHIIFLTNHAELMQKAFKVKAFRYLVKPVSKKELQESLVDAIKDINSNVKVLIDCVTDDSKSEIIVYEKDIVYIESIGEGAVVYTENHGNLISRKPLKYWAETLTEATFFQTHKSYIVSLKHVAGVSKNFVTTTVGTDIPLSKRKAAIFKDYVAQYIKSM